MDNFFKNVCYNNLDNQLATKYNVNFELPLNLDIIEIICDITTEHVYEQVKTMMRLMSPTQDISKAVKQIAYGNIEEYIKLKFSIKDSLIFNDRPHPKFPSMSEIINSLIERAIQQTISNKVESPVGSIEEERPKSLTGSSKKNRFLLDLKSKKDKEKAKEISDI